MNNELSRLLSRGWTVEAESKKRKLPLNISKRYPSVPESFLTFITGLKSCVSPDEKSWILCQPDYWEESESAFAWNEFEKQSLDAAVGDPNFRADIVEFWDGHFPIYISVRDGYKYAAISVRKTDYGKIVSGREPEYEEATIVADSLFDFLENVDSN